MKNFRNIFIAMVGVLTIAACDTDAETVAEVHDEAGFLVQVSTTSDSAILGSPEAGVALEDAEITISTARLDMSVALTSGNLNSLDRVETTLPQNLVVDGITDLLSGTGASEAGLRIGDELLIRTKVYKTDGSVYYYNTTMGHVSLVVNCASDLAGTYTNAEIPDCEGTGGDIAYVTEVTPGRYRVSSMPRYSWTSGNCIFFYMIDVCGVLTYDGGALEDNAYDGDAGVPGQVNADGSFNFTFQLPAAGYGPVEETYVPL